VDGKAVPARKEKFMLANIETLIAPRLKERADIPKSFKALTDLINVDTEADIIESIWGTLQGVEFFVTLEEAGAHVVFWRRLTSPASALARGRGRQGVKRR